MIHGQITATVTWQFPIFFENSGVFTKRKSSSHTTLLPKASCSMTTALNVSRANRVESNDKYFQPGPPKVSVSNHGISLLDS